MKGTNLGTRFRYSEYSGYFPTDMDSLKLLLPQKSSTRRIAPITDQLIQFPVAFTLKK